MEGDEEVLQRSVIESTVLPEGLRIAILDDDTVVLKMTVEMLAKKKVQVVGCHTVDELFERMRKNDYDLIITDIMLGGMSGFDLLELLRGANIGNSKTVPMLAMTGRTERSAEDFIEAGFSGCLLKPFSYGERPPRKARLKKNMAGSRLPSRHGFPPICFLHLRVMNFSPRPILAISSARHAAEEEQYSPRILSLPCSDHYCSKSNGRNA